MWERGWLSSNQVFVAGGRDSPPGLIDAGHAVHAEQTLALVRHALGSVGQAPRLLGRLVNTHLHSDHCGGNAALQALFPALHTLVPPGSFEAAREWDDQALSYRATGQQCPRFVPDAPLRIGGQVEIGHLRFEVHAAPGHDPDAVLLFEPASGLLITGDALWGDGFGVVFPELDGVAAFDTVGDTLDLIAALPVRLVVPGHGPAFTDVDAALERARARLRTWQADPQRHARHAAKALVKYHMMEVGVQPLEDLLVWMAGTPCVRGLHGRRLEGEPYAAWAAALVAELCERGKLRLALGQVHDRA